MTAVLSEFDARPINSELLQVLNELMNIFRFAQQSRGQTEPDQTKTNIEYDGLLSKCDSFSDVFEVVKSSVRESINQERAGMVLQLAELPLRIGAAHPVGTNRIVMNKALLDLAVQHRSLSEVRAFVFTLLLHEYIHSLGYLNEYETRQLVFMVSRYTFGLNHTVTHLAKYGPWHIFRGDSANQMGLN
jgi:hypothetical protein